MEVVGQLVEGFIHAFSLSSQYACTKKCVNFISYHIISFHFISFLGKKIDVRISAKSSLRTRLELE